MQRFENDEAGFTVLEVAMAAVISTVGLVFLATLFTLGIAQNRMVKQYTTTTALAQQKLEELNAVEKTSAKLVIGGGLTEATKKANYCDTVFVNPDTGVVTTDIPQGATPIYDRYWQIEADTQLANCYIISVRVAARQPTVGHKSEETTLTTVRSW